MKLLTKLGALGSCWQSPPHYSSTVSGFEQENDVVSTRLNPQPKRRTSSSAHWRPALTAISEDSASAAVVVADERRKTVKRRSPKAASRARVKPSNNYSSDADSSWKVQARIVIPAFSPAPFMF